MSIDSTSIKPTDTSQTPLDSSISTYSHTLLELENEIKKECGFTFDEKESTELRKSIKKLNWAADKENIKNQL